MWLLCWRNEAFDVRAGRGGRSWQGSTAGRCIFGIRAAGGTLTGWSGETDCICGWLVEPWTSVWYLDDVVNVLPAWV